MINHLIALMSTTSVLSTNLVVAYTAYFFGAGSPGPSNLAIMSVAAQQGRKAAMAFAFGIFSGSLIWANVATIGISAVMVTWAYFLIVVKLLGGFYLLWLAFKMGRGALKPDTVIASANERHESLRRLYVRGALLHLTNPKAILVWISIAALSSDRDGSTRDALIIGCAIIGCLIFSSYAILFSLRPCRLLYIRLRRILEAFLAVAFGVAGIRLITWSSR